MLVKDSGKSKFELPKKTTTTTSYGGGGLRRNDVSAPTSSVSDFRQYLNPQYNISKLESQSNSTTKPSGTSTAN